MVPVKIMRGRAVERSDKRTSVDRGRSCGQAMRLLEEGRAKLAC